MELLEALPEVRFIKGTVIALEVGDAERFPGPEHLASYSYAEMVPRVHFTTGGRPATGGRGRM